MIKTYISDLAHLDMSYTPYGKDPVTDRRVISFVKGEFSTDDADIQKFIENSDRFGTSIKIKPSEVEAKRAIAVSLRAAAVKANKAAADAESEVAKLESPEKAPVA